MMIVIMVVIAAIIIASIYGWFWCNLAYCISISIYLSIFIIIIYLSIFYHFQSKQAGAIDILIRAWNLRPRKVHAFSRFLE